MKLDTSKDRILAVRKFYLRGEKIDSDFRSAKRVNFGDVLGLIAIMEKLSALEDIVRTETIFERTAVELLNVPDESNDTRKKFAATFATGAEIFLNRVLIPRVEALINFTDNDFSNKRLLKFQKDLRDGMTQLRDKYREVYKM